MEVVLKCTDIPGLQQDSKTGTEVKFPALRHLTQTLSSLLRNATEVGELVCFKRALLRGFEIVTVTTL